MVNALVRRWRTGDDQEAGLTLVELIVTMVLLSVVMTLIVTAVAQSGRIVTHTKDEATGLADAKVILDRLGRDIRESRATECDGGLADPTDATSADPDCDAHLQLWVDANSDYVRQDAEVITWRLQINPDLVHYDVWRIEGLGPTAVARRQASSLIVRMAFSYDDSNFDKVQKVTLRMQYDAIVGTGTDVREVAFAARLRNKG